ncbi:hypothetical protein IB267_18705 [Ensifer sp. ENS09]|uniref:hypothetical protein n=1 Tax=Ensifer sp. ENS09 TaxID=2769263 RepID=UPI0017815A76|nr:hypothetical protein [Ensifer sp. ENS09]MBD9650373.1 hypothetical protein [Ensifer sp. ENS09]
MSGETTHGLGAYVSFPYDRNMLGEFRRTFPRARWSDERRNWFIPGKTADRRFAKWMERQLSERDPFGDARGRDAYDFDPIGSPYLEAGDDLCLRTPFSRTIVGELRQVPWAHWDDSSRSWHVPYRSYEELRKRWPVIEAAARRNEPDARKLRRLALRGSAEELEAMNRSNERRRRRYPVPAVFPPQLGRPVATETYGVVIFTAILQEIVPRGLSASYPFIKNSLMEFVWASWRFATLRELVSVWPARAGADHQRGWWLPDLEELRASRRLARTQERRHATSRSQRRNAGGARPKAH